MALCVKGGEGNSQSDAYKVKEPSWQMKGRLCREKLKRSIKKFYSQQNKNFQQGIPGR